MLKQTKSRHARIGLSVAAALAATLAAPAAPVIAQPATVPANEVTLSVGTGRVIQLDGVMADLFVANEGVADVQVRSNRSIYVFAKAPGQTTVHATDRNGRVVYSTNIRVGQNLASVGDMLSMAMPEANISATPMNGLVLLTGTVAAPADAEEAQRLTQAFVGEGTQVISRLRTATPQQVMLKVTIAEVSRSLTRNVGVNLQAFGQDFTFVQGRDFINDDGALLYQEQGTTAAGRILDVLGLNIQGAADLREQNGLVTILAEPTLTALSGETANFLAGGEFPIPVSQSLGAVTVEYRQYGVGLAFSPTVLENGRISMRVRPEISELSSAGAIELNGYQVPSLTTRRAETTVELGSGQSFVLAGLMRNNGNNSIDRTPFLGNLPIIGALFRSNGFRRDETEMVIVVTPYLVRPVSANRIVLPTDGYRSANDGQQLLLGRMHGSRSNDRRPGPTAGPPQTVTPGMTIGRANVPAPSQPLPARAPAPQRQAERPAALPAVTTVQASAQPGFEF